MHNYTKLLVTVLSLMASGNVAAHNAGFAHPQIDSVFLHTLSHYLVLIALGIGMFLISRWLIRNGKR